GKAASGLRALAPAESRQNAGAPGDGLFVHAPLSAFGSWGAPYPAPSPGLQAFRRCPPTTRDEPTHRMPWNDNANPGPWGSPPPGDGEGERKDARKPNRPNLGGPRGPRRPSGPGGPNLNDQFERLNQRLRDFFRKPGGDGVRPGAVAAVAGAAFGLWALSGLYVVQPSEQAVVTTFGSYSRSEGPGLRYHLPGPLERVEKVDVTGLNQTNIGGSAG